MATPFNITLGQAMALSGGKSCKSILDGIDAAIPGWTEDTIVDALTYCEYFRGLGESRNVNAGICYALNTAQKNTFMSWALDLLIANTPGSYAKKPDMITLKALLVDYVVAPTAPKKANLLAIAKAIKPITTSDAELLVLNAFKGVTYNVANNTVTGEILVELCRNLYLAGRALASVPVIDMGNLVLTQLEIILGIRDP